MKRLINLFADFLGLVYPQICVACGENLYKQEQVLCSKCIYELPRIDNSDFKNSKIAELFWGRVKINYVMSFFYYTKGSKYQNILHQLKYNKRQYIGIEMGRLFGYELKNSLLNSIDFIHSVPLYYKKLKKRGFNQSELIARGLSEVLKKPIISNAISRITETETQTNKSRYDRWENVQGIFKVLKPEIFNQKHVLLVDDVITTGATLEACSNAVLEIPGAQVSLASLAFTRLN